MTGRRPPALERLQRYHLGHSAERKAALFLIVSGYRILARRYRSPLGEIDIITRKGRRLGFVEVKARTTIADCEAAITGQLAQRVRNASDLWMARHPEFSTYDVGFDLVFVVPWRLPVLLRDAL